MEKFLREWRRDALNKNQFDTAVFVADKLLALTSTCPWRVTENTRVKG
jgi:anaphase-promoting complex subunit 6